MDDVCLWILEIFGIKGFYCVLFAVLIVFADIIDNLDFDYDLLVVGDVRVHECLAGLRIYRQCPWFGCKTSSFHSTLVFSTNLMGSLNKI